MFSWKLYEISQNSFSEQLSPAFVICKACLLFDFTLDRVRNKLRVTTKAIIRRCSVKQVLLKISQDSQENTNAEFLSLIKMQTETYNAIKKETLAQVFSCGTALGNCLCNYNNLLLVLLIQPTNTCERLNQKSYIFK